jgi:PAS domain S-box-containing protein
MMYEGGPTAEVELLRRQLADAEQTIKALAGGEVDAVAHSALTSPILLHQAQKELQQREQLFRAVFAGVGDGILLVDSEGVFVDANPAACVLLGVPRHEIVGRRTEDFAAPGYDAGAERQKIIEAGERRGLLVVSLPTGGLRELEYSATRDILPGLHLSLIRDVTELNRAATALIASEKKYRQIVDTAREGIWLVDEKSRTTFANRALEKMLGYAPGEMLGKSVYDFVDSEERAGTEQSLERRRQGVAERQDQKYLHKDGSAVWVRMEASPMTDDAGNYSGALAMVTDVTDRRRAEEALRGSEERYRLLFDSCPLPIWLTDVNSLQFIAVNQAALLLFGYQREAFLKLGVGDLLSSEEKLRVLQDLTASIERGVQQGTRRAIKKNGTGVELAATSQTFVLDGRLVALVIAQDMTERNRLEAQLAQSRKMEAIGILAGGVAHDFNNLLSIMVTYTAFALEALTPGEPLWTDIEQVAKAGERAVSLTRQLLAFSRQQILEPAIMDLNETVAGIEPMLRRIVGEHIEISSALEPSLGRISADPGQLEQVIMNLVVNARDAMATGGELTIETANVAVDQGLPGSPPGLKPGRYVKLAVSDTGSGIDAATRERIFEPFFTTKEVGKGTGLGLSTVLGIVQQSGGRLEVQSELGKGTTFEIYLPRVDSPLATHALKEAVTLPNGARETVLVVEDDEQVRGLVRSILRRNRYEVLVASNAGEAFLIAEQHQAPIHLLLTDVVMPRMNGRQLAERLANSRPDMKVLFMTGYTDDTAVRQGVFDAEMELLQKPITPEALARRVRAVLDGSSRSAAT